MKTLAELGIKIPKGWRRIYKGSGRWMDKRWSDAYQAFVYLISIERGLPAECFDCLIRRVREGKVDVLRRVIADAGKNPKPAAPKPTEPVPAPAAAAPKQEPPAKVVAENSKIDRANAIIRALAAGSKPAADPRIVYRHALKACGLESLMLDEQDDEALTALLAWLGKAAAAKGVDTTPYMAGGPNHNPYSKGA